MMRRISVIWLCALLVLSSVVLIVPHEAEATPLSANVKVNDESYTGQKGGTDMVVLDSGKIVTVWGEQRDGNRDIFLSYSSNNGTTFSPDMVVNKNTTGTQNSPAIASGVGDDLYVAWQDSEQGNKIYIERSQNGGLSFQDEILVSGMKNSYQTRPDIAANNETVAVVWVDSGSDNSIKIWDSATETLVKQLEGHTGAVRGLGYSPDGTKLVSGAEDNLVKFWDTGTWTETNLSDHTNYVTDIGWYSNGSYFISSSWDGSIIIWNSTDYSKLGILNEIGGMQINNPVNAVDISPDMSQIAAVYNGREIIVGPPTGIPNKYFNLTVWNTSDWSSFTINEISGNGHIDPINDVAFSHNGTLIATGSSQYMSANTIKVWNSTSGAQENVFPGLGTVNALAWSPDDNYIAAGLSNDTIVVFNHSDFADKYWLQSHNGDVNALDWHDVSDRLASGASDPIAKIWNATAGVETANLTGHRNSVYSMNWAPNGTYVATGGGNSLIKGKSESQIYCVLSTDGAQTFGPAVIVSDTLAGQKLSPEVAIDSQNETSVVWYDDRTRLDGIYFSNSTDMGATFSDDVPVSVTPTKVENLPAIAVEKNTGTVHVAWQKQTGGDISNPIHDIHYANSSDNFSQITIIDTNTSNVQQTPDICAIPDGSQIYVTWIDSRLGGYQVFLYNSSDGGVTFTGYDVVNDEDTQSKYSPAIGVNKYGDLSVVWNDYRDLGVNIYHSTSVLVDLTAPYVLSNDPMDGAINVPVLPVITYVFSEPMDQASVEAAFNVTDGTTTYYAADCLVQWNAYGDTVNFTLLLPLSNSTSQQVTIQSSANDMSGNGMASSHVFNFTTTNDDIPPTSSVDAISPYWQTGPFLVTATANDTGGSGLANTDLWYRLSTDNLTWGAWFLFGSDMMAPWAWDFTFPEGDGNYEFYSIATDNDTNVEAAPGAADTSAGLDTLDPISSIDAIGTYWQTTSPLVITATANDATSGLASVNLWYSYEGGVWADFGADVGAPWSWNFNFPNGNGNYEFYSIATDNVTNVEAAPGAADTSAGLDTVNPTSIVDAIGTYWQTTSPLAITATASDATSNLASVNLWYSYEGGVWNDFGADVGAPWSWNFNFPSGNGNYEFYSIATDVAGNFEAAPGTADASCAYDSLIPNANAGPDHITTDGSTVFFDGTGSTDNLGIWSYSWSFNDGLSNYVLSGVAPGHQFDIPGFYVVTLTVTDMAGNQDTDTMWVNVFLDTDGDGIADIFDADDDNDGVPDGDDEFPLDPTESVDTDGDGTGNNADTDDDGDGVEDNIDEFPLDPDESVDTDGDGTGNNADTDDDNDGVPDYRDQFPLDWSESVDTDGDGIGNNADPDDDGDGVLDREDPAPLDPSIWEIVGGGDVEDETPDDGFDILGNLGLIVAFLVLLTIFSFIGYRQYKDNKEEDEEEEEEAEDAEK
ncbi:MAG: Ig-like domain-containing protein [Thermoplasmata archaeon]|nr:Ig-like domain-containing protein [Thermoplasmata archaeon]